MTLANPNRVRSVDRRTVPAEDTSLAFDVDRRYEVPKGSRGKEEWAYMDSVDELTPGWYLVQDWDRWDPVIQHCGVVMLVSEFRGDVPQSPFGQIVDAGSGFSLSSFSWSKAAVDQRVS